jgi:hypothetical protein
MPPSSGQKVKKANNKIEKKAETRFLLVARFIYSSTLKIEAMRSFETSVNLHRRTLRHIPKRQYFS